MKKRFLFIVSVIYAFITLKYFKLHHHRKVAAMGILSKLEKSINYHKKIIQIEDFKELSTDIKEIAENEIYKVFEIRIYQPYDFMNLLNYKSIWLVTTLIDDDSFTIKSITYNQHFILWP